MDLAHHELESEFSIIIIIFTTLIIIITIFMTVSLKPE